MKTPSRLDPIAFYASLQRLESIPRCVDLFNSVITRLDFDAFACGEIDIADRELNVFFALQWPERWRKFYLESGLLDRDPLIEHLAVRKGPFSWSDLGKDRKFPAMGRAALQMLAAHGWTEGLVVPLPRGGTRYGLISLVGTSKGLTARQRSGLALICEQFHAKLRRIAVPGDLPLRPLGLSTREIAALELVALGKTDKEIGQDLNIAPSTAHEFVENARKRLKATTRAQMTARAASLGLLNNI